MPVLEYKGFATGYDTENDLEDVPNKAGNVENVESDKIGRIYKRNGISTVVSLTDSKILEMVKYTHKNLTNGAEWICFIEDRTISGGGS